MVFKTKEKIHEYSYLRIMGLAGICILWIHSKNLGNIEIMETNIWLIKK
jgi:hypothetical protein